MSLAATRDLQSTLGTSAEAAPKRILFVDNKPDTSGALQEALRSEAGSWQVEYASGGEAALAALAQDPADVLVAEEQMAPMDGVTLLTRVRDQHPTTIRMILSATTRPGLATIVSHRLLSKPCHVDELSVLIKRSSALHERTGGVEAFRKTMATTALPSRPGVYMELNQVLSDSDWQPHQVSAVLERDVAMSAKVLQLANSALFGLTSTVTSVRDAVMYLGVDTIRSLALTAEAFGKVAPRGSATFSLDDFQAHAMLVARITASILPAGRTQQEAVTAALLHDIGKLVLVSDGDRRWTELNHQARERNVPVHVVEQETDGVTHAHIGAHLLFLWGLPDPIVEAVAHHHDPSEVDGLAFDGVAAVHIANGLANELIPVTDGDAPAAGLDLELLDRLGLRPRLDVWRQRARELASVSG
ncbi:MAG TPA: response regulator [Solirubrobacteraceae bacterium]|jgi:HD-like signal output (HDOD) protein|nr:response regulator [Solirubrobacteraceae bacterium]